MRRILPLLGLLALGASGSSAQEPRQVLHEVVVPLSRNPLPNAQGHDLIAVEVAFPPGAEAAPHRHPGAFIYAYVLSGEVVSAIGDEEPRLYRTGESWHEDPGVLHRVTRNASKTTSARLLAIFIAPASETRLVEPALDAK